MELITYLYLNFICNQDCIFCASDKTNEDVEKKEFTLDEVLGIFRNKEPNSHFLLLNGGEPTLHKDIISIMRECEHHFERVGIATNGRKFADFDFAKTAVTAGISYVSIPIYGIGPNHNAVVQSEGAFNELQQALENIFKLREYHPLEISLKLLVSNPTYTENPHIVEWVLENLGTPDEFFLSGLRIGKKALEKADQSEVSYSTARGYINETVRRIKPVPCVVSYIPLCIFDSDTLEFILENPRNHENYEDHLIMVRPDMPIFRTHSSSHIEPQCKDCKVESVCQKTYAKNVQHFDYSREFTPLTKM